jgi:hypothetical protein
LKRQWIGIDISPTACRVMAKRLHDVCALPESEPLWRAGRGFVVRDWRSGVSAEGRHLKIGRKVCGGLPTRRDEAGESFAVPLKIRAPGFAGRSGRS